MLAENGRSERDAQNPRRALPGTYPGDSTVNTRPYTSCHVARGNTRDNRLYADNRIARVRRY